MARILTDSALVLMAFTFGALLFVYVEGDHEAMSKSAVLTPNKVMESPHNAPVTVLFVGDIMLGRAVETFIESSSTSSLFKYVGGLLSEPTVTVGNFEGVVTEVHEQAPNFTFRFSIRDKYLGMLSEQGFDVLSLANNHSLDYGTTSLAHTRERCKYYGLVCGGSPLNNDEHIRKIIEHRGVRVGILFLHTLYGGISTTTADMLMKNLNLESDVQFVYVHWGEEYMRTHSSAQEILAHVLIDAGADAVIGHHPHVIQDIELYNEKPIFYSLGNFVFDQWFNEDVKNMIAIEARISSTSLEYTVIPLTTSDSRMQPKVLDGDAKARALEPLFEPFVGLPNVQSASGTITVPM